MGSRPHWIFGAIADAQRRPGPSGAASVRASSSGKTFRQRARGTSSVASSETRISCSMLSLISRGRLWIKTALKTALVVPGLLQLLAGSRPAGLRVLFYHRVNPYPFDKLGPVSRETTVRPEAFARQLEYLRRQGFRTVSPEELLAMLTSEVSAANERVIAITFDDGYEDNLLWATPLLKAHGFQAIVFVITGFIGKESGEVWAEGDPSGFGRFLSRQQLRELLAAGMFVGSHTHSHRPLTGLDDDDLQAELGRSRRVLEEIAGAPALLLAYPGGDFDHRSESTATRAGYAASFTTIPGVNETATRLQALRRTEVSASDTFFLFRMKVAGALDWLWFKEAPGLRRVIGVTNRWLFRLLAR